MSEDDVWWRGVLTLGHLGLHETRRTRGLSEIFSVFIVSDSLAGVFLERFNLWNFHTLIFFFSSHTTEDWLALIFPLISRGLREEGLTPHLRAHRGKPGPMFVKDVSRQRFKNSSSQRKKSPAEPHMPEHPTRNQTHNLVHIQLFSCIHIYSVLKKINLNWKSQKACKM